MRSLKLVMLFLPLVIFTFTSCDEEQKEKAENTAEDIGEGIETAANEVKEEVQDFTDKMFVSDVIEVNMEVIELLEMGETKGGERVQQIVNDNRDAHEKLGTAFKNYAKDNNIDYRIRNQFRDIERMGAGNNWDTEWYNQMEDELEKLVRKMERKTDNANDPFLQEMAQNNLPVLRKHLVQVSSAGK